MKRGKYFGWMMVLLAAGFLGGCGGSSGNGASGALSVQLVDATLPGFEAIYVTIDHVDVHPQGGDWATVLTPHRTVNLLELVNGVQEHLGLADLAAGPYDQLRLVLSGAPDDGLNLQGNPHPFANYFIDDTGQVRALKVPSGLQTGIKLVGGFTIASGQTTILVLDFDASRSVVIAGNSGQALLKPTIKVVASAATVTGTVTETAAAPLPGTMVSAQTTDPTITELSASRLVAGTLTDAGGRYALFLNPGSFQLTAFRPVQDGLAYLPACRMVTVIADQVLAGQDFTLAPAPFGALAGTVTIANAVPDQHAVLSLRQAAPAPCIFPLELATLNLADGGTFNLSLPAGVYQLVGFGEGLPAQSFDVTIGEGATTVQDFAF